MGNRYVKEDIKVGAKIGNLTILSERRIDVNGKNTRGVECVCDCGATITTYWYSVKYGLKKSCGCKYRPSLVGETYGKLKVVGIGGIERNHRLYICLCECGNFREIIGARLTNGTNKSCGCSQGAVKTTYKYRSHPLYGVWKGMKQRCINPKHIAYPIYGARGVKVCEEWATNFISFYNWAICNGWEKGMQIDKDKKGITKMYSPETCCILTPKENSRISRQAKIGAENAAIIRQSKETIRALAKKYGVIPHTIQNIKSGKTWS